MPCSSGHSTGPRLLCRGPGGLATGLRVQGPAHCAGAYGGITAMKATVQSSVSLRKTMGERWSRTLHREESLGYFLSAPSLIFLAVMLAYPLVLAVYLLSLIHISERTRLG